MARKTKKTRVKCEFFVWLLGNRDGVFYADGRGNVPPLGRHSLGTKDRTAAMESLTELDRVKAVELGRIKKRPTEPSPGIPLELADGWRLYLAHVNRPRVTGGAKPKTIQRYNAVRDKFLLFAQARQISSWNQVTEELITEYAKSLEQKQYAHASLYLELTTVKQCIKYLAATGRIEMPRITLQLAKPRETDTYCWRPVEVEAILQCCQETGGLTWLGDICLALSCTGLRISELAALRWSDIDWEANTIRLTDETTLAVKSTRSARRQTKTGRSRIFPIHPSLRQVLEGLKSAADGLVFHGPRGRRVNPDTVRRNLISDVLNKLAKRFPKPEGERGFQDGRLHSFRHYFCSECANSGIPELVVMRWLGHRDSDMVHRYYHLHDQEAQRYMKQLAVRQAAG